MSEDKALKFYNPKGGAVRAIQYTADLDLEPLGLEAEGLGGGMTQISASPGPRDINGATRRSFIKEGDYIVVFPYGGFDVVPSARFEQTYGVVK